MEFQIVLTDSSGFLSEDVGYSLGYFRLVGKDISANFFDERYCMVFLTLTELLDFLSSERLGNGVMHLWVGTDNGAGIEMTALKNKLSIARDGVTVNILLADFVTAVFKGTLAFVEECGRQNPEAASCSPFIDLQEAIQNLEKRFSKNKFI